MNKQRTLRRVFTLLLALCLIFGEAAPLGQTASAVTQAEINALKKDSDSLAAKKSSINAQLNALAKDKKNTLARKALLDEQLSVVSSEIENTQQQIEQYELLIEQTTQELADAEAREDEQYEVFCRRVRAMEERGTVSYWSVLFRSASFQELLGAMDFISEVMDADQRAIDDLRALQQEITLKKEELSLALTEQQAAHAALETRQSELDTQRDEANALIRQINENQDEYADVLAEVEAEEKRTQEEIVRLSRELAAQQANTKTTYGGYIWPVTTSKRITSPFGQRNTGIAGASTNHKGIDIGGVYYDSSVYASKAGTVIISTYNNVRGNYIVISHGSGNTTTYQHLSKRLVSVGAVVRQGDKIGITGSSGVGSGPHLHFEITENGQLVDPLKYLTDYVRAW